MQTREELKQEYKKQTFISAFEPCTLIPGILIAFLVGAVCMNIIGKMGTTPNTSLLGAIVAMLVARIPINACLKYCNLERQNLLQTIASAAGFSAANCGFIAVAMLFLMGEASSILMMGVGCMIGTSISIYIIGRIYDSAIFPAQGAWPPGVATATAIQAGDEGGKKGRRLLEGLVIGVVGSYFKLPVAGIGIVFIANIVAMTGLGVGLVLRGFSTQLFGFDLGATNIPSGVMIGAGMVALVQSVVTVVKGHKSASEQKIQVTVSQDSAKKSLVLALGLYVGGAVLLGALTGIFAQMSPALSVVWVLWSAFSSLVAMVLVGMAAMYSGWFPAFAITTIFMTFGILMGFPTLPVAILTGYVSSVGPCFADMGYDLKTGWILRGEGKDQARELQGRREQVKIELLGGIIGIVVVLMFANMYLSQDIMPPISYTFAATIQAGANMDLLQELLIWAIPGAIIQIIFGSKMVGVLFATGLLLNNPVYGIGVLLAIVVRMIFGTKFMEVRDSGLIAGDGLYGFFSNLIKSMMM